MFDFTVLGIIMVFITILFFAVIGHRMLPKSANQELGSIYGIRSYLSEIQILEKSPLINQIVHNSDLFKRGFEIFAIRRDGRQFSPGPNITFQEGDLVLVKGVVKNLMEIQNIKGINITTDLLEFYREQSQSLKLREIVLPGCSTILLIIRVNYWLFKIIQTKVKIIGESTAAVRSSYLHQ
jgi:uncharacterized transporter YbjL